MSVSDNGIANVICVESVLYCGMIGKYYLKVKGLTFTPIAPDKHQSIAETSKTFESLALNSNLAKTDDNFNKNCYREKI